MATEIAERSQRLAPGTVAGVAGNTREHGERLIDLVHEIAAARGWNIAHVKFKALDTEAIVSDAARRH